MEGAGRGAPDRSPVLCFRPGMAGDATLTRRDGWRWARSRVPSFLRKSM